MDNTSEFQLCSACSKIPFDLVFSGRVDDDFPVWQYMTRDEWTETCSLCSYLVRCLSSAQLHFPNQPITTGLGFYRICKGNRDIRNLQLQVSAKADWRRSVAIGPILCVTRKWQQLAGQPEAVPLFLSYATITNWINKAIGNPKSRDEPASLSGWTVPLKVIDCATRSLILLPEKEPYVTLRYVWGSVDPGQIAPESGKNGRESLPSPLPATIEDSITVCLGLNFRYMWVDRYCVYGTDDMRAQQIKEMDKVYYGSVLTVIACAGMDPTYGLPGVSRPRTSYPSLKVKDLGYLWAFSSPEDIGNSIWATRGWTFQEALLSRCQLYFTEKQLFLGLYDTSKSESGGWVPEETAHISQGTLSLGAMRTYSCIGEYSTKRLSYPEDALNALLGILSRLQKDRGVLHLWGLPFRGSNCIMTTALAPDELLFEESLCWQAINPTRREGFPTWSWTSNDGTVSCILGPVRAIGCKLPGRDATPGFEVELMSGKLCSLSEYQLRYDDLNKYGKAMTSKDRPSRFIHIEAFVTSVDSIRTIDKVYTVSVKSTTGESISLGSQRVATSAPTSPKSVLIIHLIYSSPNYALIVGNMGNYWERVCIIITGTDLMSLHKVRRKIRLG